MNPTRWVEYLKAKAGGYFWLPCPLCGRNFGGHEWDHKDSIPDLGTSGHSEGVCPDCGEMFREELDELEDIRRDIYGRLMDEYGHTQGTPYSRYE